MLLGQGHLKQGLRRCRSTLTSDHLVSAVPYLMLQRVLNRRVGGGTKGRGRVLSYWVPRSLATATLTTRQWLDR
jgi:hypothetical protein